MADLFPHRTSLMGLHLHGFFLDFFSYTIPLIMLIISLLFTLNLITFLDKGPYVTLMPLPLTWA
jgi:hypothetical protein